MIKITLQTRTPRVWKYYNLRCDIKVKMVYKSICTVRVQSLAPHQSYPTTFWSMSRRIEDETSNISKLLDQCRLTEKFFWSGVNLHSAGQLVFQQSYDTNDLLTWITGSVQTLTLTQNLTSYTDFGIDAAFCKERNCITCPDPPLLLSHATRLQTAPLYSQRNSSINHPAASSPPNKQYLTPIGPGGPNFDFDKVIRCSHIRPVNRDHTPHPTSKRSTRGCNQGTATSWNATSFSLYLSSKRMKKTCQEATSGIEQVLWLDRWVAFSWLAGGCFDMSCEKKWHLWGTGAWDLEWDWYGGVHNLAFKKESFGALIMRRWIWIT
jgi:hypothetical protein